MYRKNSNYSKNNKFIRIANRSKFFSSQIFVAILAKIWLIEIACRNKKKSAKIAKVTRNFIATKRHPDNYRKNCKNDRVTKERKRYSKISQKSKN